MARALSIPLRSLRFASVIAAVFLYALLSSPTPDHPGAPEIAVALLLIAGIGFSGAYNVLKASADEPFWMGAGRVLFLYGATLPLLIGAARGADPLLIARDLIPFLFFLLPLFLFPLFKARPKTARYFAGAIILAGLLFSLRAVYYLIPWAGLRNFLNADSGELFYFANAPTVLFAALFLIGVGGKKIFEAKSVADILPGAAMVALSCLPLAAMTLAAQRASLASIALYVFILCALAFRTNPARAWRVLIPAVGFCLIFGSDLGEIGRALLYKTREVGMNMRLEEARAVWSEIANDPFRLLTGAGWGATFASPATGGAVVNFTHSLFTSYLFKTGLLGALAMAAYIGGLLDWLARLVFRAPAQGVALAAPILIDVLFYASFKSLDFGLVLSLVPASLLYWRAFQDSPPALENRREADFWVLYADNRVEICLGQASFS